MAQTRRCPDRTRQVGQSSGRPYTFSMENDKCERRPLDVFDATDDGFRPHTLAETLAVADDLVPAFDALVEALQGCMTPLILDQTLWKTKKLRAEVATMADELRRAREIIELDLPLANELPFIPGEKWAGTLSPDLVIEVRAHADQVHPNETTTYRQQVEAASGIPSLVARRRRKLAREAEWDVLPDHEKAARASRRGPLSGGRTAYIAARKEAARNEWELFEQVSAEFDRASREPSVGGPEMTEPPAEG